MKQPVWFILVTTQLMASSAAVAQTDTSAVTQADTAALRVSLVPLAAASAGAQWRADQGRWRNSTTVAMDLTAGDHDLSFKSIVGWIAPTNQNVMLAAGITNQRAAIYVPSPTNPALAAVPDTATNPPPAQPFRAALPPPPQNLRVVSGP